MEKRFWQPVLDELRSFSTVERPVYMVGGAVRDMLLGRPLHDLDFALSGGTRKLANEIACRFQGALYVLDEERDTTRVLLDLNPGGRLVLDFAALRGKDIEADLRARDFTINAMAMDVAQQDRLIDPLGGLADLREKRIRACAPDSLERDPVRVLRAVRQALNFEMRIDPGTIQQMREAAPRIASISAERQRDELFRVLEGSQVALGMRVLDQVGALRVVLPELEQLKGVSQSAPHTEPVWEHTLRTLEHLETLLGPLVGSYQQDRVADLTVGSAVLWLGRFREHLEQHLQHPLVESRTARGLLFLAALYHDIGKPEARMETSAGRVRFIGHEARGAAQAARRARALALSGAEVNRLETVVANHMRVHQMANGLLRARQQGTDEKISRRTIYRFFEETREAGVDICLLSLADARGTYGVTLPPDVWETELEACRLLLEGYWEKREEVVAPPRLLSGSELIGAFDMTPGPEVGRLLSAVREAQAVGDVTTRDEALAFASHWLRRGEQKNQDSSLEEREP